MSYNIVYASFKVIVIKTVCSPETVLESIPDRKGIIVKEFVRSSGPILTTNTPENVRVPTPVEIFVNTFFSK